MPLQTGSSQTIISRNIAEMVKAGHPQKQAIAAAYANAKDESQSTGSSRQYDYNGWFEIQGNPVSKVGVYEYTLGLQHGAKVPGRYKVLRCPEELGHPDTIASARLLPWINDHMMLGKVPGGVPAEQKGIQGVLGQDTYFDGEILYTNLKIFSESMEGLIDKAGKVQLSCGYNCKWDWTPGVWNGQPYDVVQRRIRFNHIALVGKGRLGPDFSVMDSVDGDDVMPETECFDSGLGNDARPNGAQAQSDGADMATEENKQEPEKKEPEKKEPEAPAKDDAGEASKEKEDQMTLEQALALLKQIVPIINEAGALVGKTAESEKSEAEQAELKPNPEEKKEAPAMDAAEIGKQVRADLSAKAKLYPSLSAVVGAFDHDDMNHAEMAAYGCTKLGLTAPKGAEAAVLGAFLKAKGEVKTAPGMDQSDKSKKPAKTGFLDSLGARVA